MRKLLFIFIFLLSSMSLFAVETIQSHNPIYFITGNNDNQAKYQVSFKYSLWYNSGAYLSYTQLSKWNIYDQSSPFKETNYNPGIFWEKENLWKLDLLRIIPYEHKSNGRDGQESRSIDRYFIEVQYSIGDKFNLGIREKVGAYYKVSNKNKDIDHYLGYFQTELFFQIKSKHEFFDHEKIYIKGEWMHNRLNTKYWFETGLSFRIITAYIQPNFYIQYYKGYGEFLLDYNKKTNALRAGLIFNI